jgi:hypothetical protein
MSEVTPCSVAGCVKPGFYKYTGYCIAHHARYLRNGDPGGPDVIVRGLPKPPCSIADCERTSFLTGLCQKHYRRKQVHGDPLYVQPKTGEYNNCYRGDNIAITTAHYRVTVARGKACDHQCVQCGEQAKHWAYDHADPNEKDGGKAGLYSPDPDHYQPMCVPCHKRFDLAHLCSDVR